MNRILHKWIIAALLLLIVFGGIVTAQIASPQGRTQAVSSSDLQAMKQVFEASQRHEAALKAIEQDKDGFVRDIVARWATAATERGSGDRGLVMLKAGLMQAGAEKLIRANEASSYDGVLAVLYGSTPLAAASSTASAPMLLASPNDRVTADPNALGNNSLDLVYTPIQPCRALDSRFATGSYSGSSFHGPYAANSTHSFAVTDPIDFYGSQGGVATCGIPVTAAKAVVLNITAVNPWGQGDLRIYPWGTSAPNASIVNYGAANIANAVVAPICLNCNQDLIVLNDAMATDVIVDVLGYFAAPFATAVGTTIVTTGPSTISAAGGYSVASPTCPTGYTLVGGGFNEGLQFTGNWIWQNGPSGTTWLVRGNNQTGGSLSLTVYGVCAQVPGR